MEKTDGRSKLRQVMQTRLARVESRFKQWIKPAQTNQGLSTLADMSRSKRELIAENVFLRQQVIALERQVAHPQLKQRDRQLLVVLASRIQDWSLARGAHHRAARDIDPLAQPRFQAVLTTEITGQIGEAADRSGDDRADRRHGDEEPHLAPNAFRVSCSSWGSRSVAIRSGSTCGKPARSCPRSNAAKVGPLFSRITLARRRRATSCKRRICSFERYSCTSSLN